MKPKSKKPKSDLRANDGTFIPGSVCGQCEDSCKSCGIPWHEYLGISGTCAKLEKARMSLQIIITWCRNPTPGATTLTTEFDDIANLCDKTLEAIK